jgi:hypothetical protein
MFSSGPARSPPRLHAPSGQLRMLWRCLHITSAHALCEQDLIVIPLVGLQRIPSTRPQILSPETAPVRAFRPAFRSLEAAFNETPILLSSSPVGRLTNRLSPLKE